MSAPQFGKNMEQLIKYTILSHREPYSLRSKLSFFANRKSSVFVLSLFNFTSYKIIVTILLNAYFKY